MRRKNTENLGRFKRMMLVVCGSWTTMSIVRKEDRKFSEDECLYYFYQNTLRSGLWFDDNAQLRRIEETLKRQNLTKEQRIRLRSYIHIDVFNRSDVFNVMSMLIPMLVAALIGFGVAISQDTSIMKQVSTNQAFFGAIIVITIYVFILNHLSRRRTKASVVKEGLDIYEKLMDTP